jgi:glycosyltransferase involved in cell wall biosynthesis
LLVCSQIERDRTGRPRTVQVIPHFVEPRVLGSSRSEAKAALGLTGKRIVTLLGYIHSRKGHRLVVDALPHLPEDVVAVFAGRAAQEEHGLVEQLRHRAALAGVSRRLIITGYLTDDRLAQHLAATDLAVCPFAALSASGSLSTWISSGRSIVASDLPQIREYNALEPGAIATFAPYSPAALAGAILRAFERGGDEFDAGITRLRGRLLLPHIVERHLDTYQAAVRARGSSLYPRRIRAGA